MKKLLLLGLLLSSTAWAEETIRIQVLTKDQTEVGEYSDAQYFTVPENTNITEWKAEHQKEIDEERQKRVQNFIDSVKNPPKEPVKTAEELLAEKQALAEQQEQVVNRMIEIDSKIDEIQAAKIEAGIAEEVKAI